MMFVDAVRLLLFPATMAFAASTDLLTMTISNRVSIILAVGFVVLAALQGMPLVDVGSHFAAALLVLAVGFVFFWRGWIGGGDAKLAAQALLEALPPGSNADRPFRSEETLGFLREFDIARDFVPANTPRTVDPRALGVALEKLLPANRNLVYDAGNFLGIVPYLSVPDPGRFKLTSDFASIGLGFGTALGVAKARPDETTVLVIGDGGFLMTMGELETVVREDLPLIIVLMNDCAYGAELHFLKMRDLPVAKSVFPDVDYAPIAEAFGFQAATIRTLDDLQKLAPLLARPDGPLFLDCKLNAAVAAPFMSEFHEFETRKH